VAVLGLGLAISGVIASGDNGRVEFVPSGEPVELARSDAERALADAGCRAVVDGEPLEDRDHVEARGAPAADVLYGDEVRPNHSGRHFPVWQDTQTFVPEQPIDERSVTHNLEHGAVVIWFEDLDRGAASELADWMQERRDLGFQSASGGGLF